MSSQNNQISKFSSFQMEGLKNVEQAIFSHKNLIIGKNGSGKTRFLKTLEQEKSGNAQIRRLSSRYIFLKFLLFITRSE